MKPDSWDVSVNVGGALTLRYSIYDAGGNKLPSDAVSWYLDDKRDESVATVSESGLVRGIGTGTAYVIAIPTGSSRDKVGSVSITVGPSAAAFDAVAYVKLEEEDVSVNVGRALQLRYSVHDAAGNELPSDAVTWYLDDKRYESVATVSESGLVRGIGTGTAYVIAIPTGSSRDKVGAVSITVEPSAAAVGPANYVELEQEIIIIDVGEEVQLNYSVYDAAGNTLTLGPDAWFKSVQSMVTVTASGLVRGIAPGTTLVAPIFSGRKWAPVTITVRAKTDIVPPGPEPSAPFIEVEQNIVAMDVGDEVQLNYSAYDGAGSNLPINAVGWLSSNQSVVTVSARGMVLGIAPGTAEVTPYWSGQPQTPVTIIVRPQTSSVPTDGSQTVVQPAPTAGEELGMVDVVAGQLYTAGTRLKFPLEGISLLLPQDAYGFIDSTGQFVILYESSPEAVFMWFHGYTNNIALASFLTEGISLDQDTTLKPSGPYSMVQVNWLGIEMTIEEYAPNISGSSFTFGGYSYVMALAREGGMGPMYIGLDEYREGQLLPQLVQELAVNTTMVDPEVDYASSIAQQWQETLGNKLLSHIDVETGASGGSRDRDELSLCGDGRFASYSESGYLTTGISNRASDFKTFRQDISEQGQWRVFSHGGEAYLELVMDAGKVSQFLVQDTGNSDQILINGVHWWIFEADCPG